MPEVKRSSLTPLKYAGKCLHMADEVQNRGQGITININTTTAPAPGQLPRESLHRPLGESVRATMGLLEEGATESATEDFKKLAKPL